jgi:hypothetical protein
MLLPSKSLRLSLSLFPSSFPLPSSLPWPPLNALRPPTDTHTHSLSLPSFLHPFIPPSFTRLEIIHNSSSPCNVTAVDRVNHLYRSFLASNFPASLTAAPSIAPAPGSKLASPYQEILFPAGVSFGVQLEEEEDSD